MQTIDSERRLSARLVFHAVSHDNEPLGEDFEVRVDPAGFWDPQSAGGPGEDAQPMTVGEVAMQLEQEFDYNLIRAILTHFESLQRQLSPARRSF